MRVMPGAHPETSTATQLRAKIGGGFIRTTVLIGLFLVQYKLPPRIEFVSFPPLHPAQQTWVGGPNDCANSGFYGLGFAVLRRLVCTGLNDSIPLGLRNFTNLLMRRSLQAADLTLSEKAPCPSMDGTIERINCRLAAKAWCSSSCHHPLACRNLPSSRRRDCRSFGD